MEMEDFPIAPAQIATLIQLVDDSKISNTVASQKLFPLLIENSSKDPLTIAKENNWIQESNQDTLQKFVQAALAKYPTKVEEYKNGKKGVLGLFMGEVMKMSQGKADPKVTNQLVREALEK
jgi:aspartyl-tRNA(Asn)/glutamyl-tRNA(Gln) amidotransferase subunit B